MMKWLLIFFPIAVGLEFFAPGRHLLIFAASCLAILPLAGWLAGRPSRLQREWGKESVGC